MEIVRPAEFKHEIKAVAIPERPEALIGQILDKLLGHPPRFLSTY
jgi:hypothetical protein